MNSTKKDNMYSVRVLLPKETAKRLALTCIDTRQSKSTFALAAIERYLDNYEAHDGKVASDGK